MPTGVAMRDVREQLFEAAERILLRSGPSALTSRALTEEAGCAKGVLHRHFADFDAFLAELVLDRRDRMTTEAATLSARAGSGTVAGNLADFLGAVFGPVAMGILALVSFRDELRARLRQSWPSGVPLLTDAATMTADYLSAEQAIGRVGVEAEVTTVAPMLIGAVHLLFADREAGPPDTESVRRTITSMLR
ncbi:TetR/AcrR family transcriptional regulator [Sciscionella sediminilitoris]|uniref:TetR/AcrR family transcriptional regulator n=1 Tax=Sciscionella sediminilitoris TaxID=1445613 RepID=UPI0004DF8C8E|nr:TetR/AcrR family transcriptional regulator [Sciscionella sp. SE31]